MSIEILEAINPYRVRLMCDCGGEIVFTGESRTYNGDSTMYHKCNKCNKEEFIKNKRYPTIIYKTAEEME